MLQSYVSQSGLLGFLNYTLIFPFMYYAYAEPYLQVDASNQESVGSEQPGDVIVSINWGWEYFFLKMKLIQIKRS